MTKLTRRRLLHTLTYSAAGFLILKNPRSARAYSANDLLNIALIGVGGRGKWYVDVIPKQAHVVAFCDVNDSKATAAYREHPEVPKFRDFRELLDKRQAEIDGVIVATPDHTHAIAAVTAMRAGKHAFVESPCAVASPKPASCGRRPRSSRSPRRWATRARPAPSSAAVWN